MEPAPVDLGDQEERREAALGGAVADPPQLVVARLHDHPVTDRGRRDLGADPVHDAGHLVTEAHRGTGRAGQPTHADVREVAPADAAGRHPDDGVPGAGVGRGDLVDPDIVGPVDSYLQHGQRSVRTRRGRRGTTWPRAWPWPPPRSGPRTHCGGRRRRPGPPPRPGRRAAAGTRRRPGGSSGITSPVPPGGRPTG